MRVDWLRPEPKKFILPAIIIILFAIITINNYVGSNRIVSMVLADSDQEKLSEKEFSDSTKFILYSNKFFESIYPFHISPGFIMQKGNNVKYTYLNEENYHKVIELNEKLTELTSNASLSGAGLLAIFGPEEHRSPIFPIIIEAIILGLVAYVINSLIFIKKKKSAEVLK
jgi:hypothetical protein